MNNRFLIILLILNCFCLSSATKAQSNIELDSLSSYLKDNSDDQVLVRLKAYDLINRKNEKDVVVILNAFEKKLKGSNAEIVTRFKALRARLLFYKLDAGDSLYAADMKSALHESYKYDNQFMIVEYSRWYGEMTNSLGNLQEAIQYCAFSIKIQEILGVEHFPSFGSFNLNLGEMLYKSANFKEAKYYFLNGIQSSTTEKIPAFQLGFAFNSLAMCYRSLSIFDSAILYCFKGMDFAKKNKLDDIYYACSDNRFDPYIELNQVDSCKVIADNLYQFSIDNKNDYYLAASYYMKARIAFNLKDYKSCIQYLEQSSNLYNSLNESKNNIQVYKFLAASYRNLGDSINANLYYQKFLEMKKVQETRTQTINSNFLLAKADFEQEQIKFKQLYHQKNREIAIRNIGIALLLLLSISAAWWINKKRQEALKIKLKTEERYLDLSSEFEQKNEEIGHLQKKLETKELDVEKQSIVEELKTKAILTNDDWVDFQTRFKQIYPSFLFKIKEQFLEITESELRMAALMKIQLNTKESAAILGISPDSVHKTRQRLRQRIGVTDTLELEQFIAHMN